jgi:hypothetical protein
LKPVVFFTGRTGPLRILLLVSGQTIKNSSLSESLVWNDGKTETLRKMSCSWLPSALLWFQLATELFHFWWKMLTGTIPIWLLVPFPVWQLSHPAPAGMGYLGDLSHSCKQGLGSLKQRVALGRSDLASQDLISVGCQRPNVTALQGHFQRHCLSVTLSMGLA